MAEGALLLLLQNPSTTLKHYPSLLLFTALLFSHGIRAQVINQGNFEPSLGEQFISHQGNYVDPGSAPNMNWNFSSLSSAQSATIEYMTQAATGYGGTFPNTTIAASTGAGQYAYYQFHPAGMFLTGVRSDNVDVTMVYQNSEQQIAFPCDQNASWYDPFSSTYMANGISCTRNGTTTGAGQAVGTLIMPYGSIPNVLRIRVEQNMTDVLGVYGAMETHTITYAYLKPGIHYTILSVSDQTITSGGVDQQTLSSLWLDQSSVGIAEAMRNAIGIDIFPNPARDRATINFNSTGTAMELAVLDGTGRTVLSETMDGHVPGIGQHELDLTRLPAGMYLLRLTDAQGQQGVQRLVVQ